jgi:hypothetical protein
VEFILEDFEKIIDNSTGNSSGSEDFQKIKDNSTGNSIGNLWGNSTGTCST